jgi:hypothetical protein
LTFAPFSGKKLLHYTAFFREKSKNVNMAWHPRPIHKKVGFGFSVEKTEEEVLMRTHTKYLLRLVFPLLIFMVALVMPAHAGGEPRFRVMNAAPDSPPADIYLDGQKIISNLGYKAVSGYQAVTPGTHRIKVTQAGAGADAPGVIESDLSFADGQDYTLVAMGKLESLEFRQFKDDNNPPEGAEKSKVRFIHTAIDLGAVDVCGTGQSNCFVTNLTYTNATSYALPDAGVYSLDVRQTGTNNIVKSFPNVRFNKGEVYTIFLVGLVNGSKPLEIVMSTDARWEPPQPPVTGAFLSPTAQVVVVGIFMGLMVGIWLLWRTISKFRVAA